MSKGIQTSKIAGRKEYHPNIVILTREDFKQNQLNAIEALCRINDMTLKDVTFEQVLSWANRQTDGHDGLDRELRKKLGKEWDYCYNRS